MLLRCCVQTSSVHTTFTLVLMSTMQRRANPALNRTAAGQRDASSRGSVRRCRLVWRWAAAGMRYVLPIALSLLACSCTPRGGGTFFTSGISAYKGDGVIEDTSQRAILFGTSGYLVALPHFPLDKPYENTFRLDGLPTIDGSRTEVVFLVPETFSRNRAANTNSIVEFSLVGKGRTDVIHVKSTLGSLIWSSPVHGHPGSALYHLDRSFFQAVPGELYRLHVTYSSAPGAAGGKGYFYLRSEIGGS